MTVRRISFLLTVSLLVFVGCKNNQTVKDAYKTVEKESKEHQIEEENYKKTGETSSTSNETERSITEEQAIKDEEEARLNPTLFNIDAKKYVKIIEKGGNLTVKEEEEGNYAIHFNNTNLVEYIFTYNDAAVSKIQSIQLVIERSYSKNYDLMVGELSYFLTYTGELDKPLDQLMNMKKLKDSTFLVNKNIQITFNVQDNGDVTGCNIYPFDYEDEEQLSGLANITSNGVEYLK